jgi:hypothetical protein
MKLRGCTISTTASWIKVQLHEKELHFIIPIKFYFQMTQDLYIIIQKK